MESDTSDKPFLNRLKFLFKKTPKKATREEIYDIIDEVEQKGFIDEDQGDMIHNIIVLKDTEVHEIMVPRVDIVGLNTDVTVDDVVKTIIDSGHSRIPIFDRNSGNIVGIIYAKDLLPFWHSPTEDIYIKNIMREPYFVPEGKKLIDLLDEFRKKRLNMAIVIDEYGNVDGLLTLVDIIEEIVGDIPGDNEEVQPSIIDQGGGVYLVDPRMPIDDFCKAFSIDIPEGDYDTIAGFITYLMERIPSPGETLEYGGLVFKVAGAEKKRISKLIVYVPEGLKD